ncbi:MAG: hypothetical protein QOK90_10540 [Nitrososphaeraceae archaeon]|nr:hypothetical protein [Nitrososphaeraceae archaeon]
MEYEVLQYVADVTLGFLPMLGTLELGWRLSKKRKAMIKKMPAHVLLQQ